MKFRTSSLRLLNLVLCVVFAIMVGIAIFQYSTPMFAEFPPMPTPKTPSLPMSFAYTESFEKMHESPFLSLQPLPIKPRLPDLRNIILYYGSNHRPDVNSETSMVQIGLRGDTVQHSVAANSPIYLKTESRHEFKQMPVRWTFSANNSPTSVWVEIHPQGIREARVLVFMKDAEQQMISEPQEYASFLATQVRLPQHPASQAAWEVGGMRVDGSLLVKQKALWFGRDLFLEELGGDDDIYSELSGAERITFTKLDGTVYSCFIFKGEAFAFIDDEWREVALGPDSREKPLLVLQEIDDRAMHFDLWDPQGKNRLQLQLPKSVAPRFMLDKNFIKLVGARSRKDWIAEIIGKRVLLRSDDWLLFQNGGSWVKIADAQMLEDYVEGRLKGVLVVLEGTEKVDNESFLVGRIFDETRTQQLPLKITLFKSWQPQNKKKRDVSLDDDDDDDDDDDFDDDDDDDFDDDDFDDDDFDEDEDEDDEEGLI